MVVAPLVMPLVIRGILHPSFVSAAVLAALILPWVWLSVLDRQLRRRVR